MILVKCYLHPTMTNGFVFLFLMSLSLQLTEFLEYQSGMIRVDFKDVQIVVISIFCSSRRLKLFPYLEHLMIWSSNIHRNRFVRVNRSGPLVMTRYCFKSWMTALFCNTFVQEDGPIDVRHQTSLIQDQRRRTLNIPKSWTQRSLYPDCDLILNLTGLWKWL